MIHDYWHDGVEYHVHYTLLKDDEIEILLEAAIDLASGPFDVSLILITADNVKRPVFAVRKGEKGVLELQLRECPYTNDIEATILGVYPYEVQVSTLSTGELCNRL